MNVLNLTKDQRRELFISRLPKGLGDNSIEKRRQRVKTYAQRYSKEHPEKIREIKKRYIEKLKRERPEKWREILKRDSEAAKKRDPDKVRDRISRSVKKWKLKHPERYTATRRVYAALRNGTLKKEPCFVCHSTNRIEAHHQDYSHPLAVVWVCKQHHLRLDKIRREGESQAEVGD